MYRLSPTQSHTHFGIQPARCSRAKAQSPVALSTAVQFGNSPETITIDSPDHFFNVLEGLDSLAKRSLSTEAFKQQSEQVDALITYLTNKKNYEALKTFNLIDIEPFGLDETHRAITFPKSPHLKIKLTYDCNNKPLVSIFNTQKIKKNGLFYRTLIEPLRSMVTQPKNPSLIYSTFSAPRRHQNQNYRITERAIAEKLEMFLREDMDTPQQAFYEKFKNLKPIHSDHAKKFIYLKDEIFPNVEPIINELTEKNSDTYINYKVDDGEFPGSYQITFPSSHSDLKITLSHKIPGSHEDSHLNHPYSERLRSITLREDIPIIEITSGNDPAQYWYKTFNVWSEQETDEYLKKELALAEKLEAFLIPNEADRLGWKTQTT